MATFYHFNLTSQDQDHFIFYCSNKKVMVLQHSLKKRIFVLRKFVKTVEKIMFLFVLVCFCHGNIIFSELFFKRKCKKAASFRKCVFLRKYEIFVYDSCDDEIFYVVLLRKPAIFHLHLGQLFIDNI